MQVIEYHTVTSATDGKKTAPYIKPSAYVKEKNATRGNLNAPKSKKGVLCIEPRAAVNKKSATKTIPNPPMGNPRFGTASGRPRTEGVSFGFRRGSF